MFDQTFTADLIPRLKTVLKDQKLEDKIHGTKDDEAFHFLSSIAQLLEPSDSNTPTVDDLIPIAIDGEEKEDAETEGFKTVLATRDKLSAEQNEAARVDEME